jgi:hypothetical protein
MKHNCIHCREEIEKTNRIFCGWQHKGTRQVICRLTDMDVLCQMIQNHNDEPSPLYDTFKQTEKP